MKRKEVDQIKKFLTGNGGRRLEQARAAQLGIRRRLPSKNLQRAAEKLLAPMLDQSAAKQFSNILAKEQAKVEAALKKSRVTALKKGRAARKALDAACAQQMEALQAVAGSSPTDAPYYELLTKPLLITPSSSIYLEGSEIVPSNSWAKFHVGVEVGYFGDSAEFDGDVKFYYLWSNPKDTYVVINANGYIIFNGFADILVNESLSPLPSPNYGSILISGKLDILEWWNQPATSPLEQANQTARVATLSVDASGWAEYLDFESEEIYRGYDLSHTLMVVPPYGTVIFGVTAVVSTWIIHKGNAKVNFAEGPFQVSSPGVLVTMLN